MKELIWVTVFFSLILFSCARSTEISEDGETNSVVSFPNTECTTSDGTTGVCHTKNECTQKGGVPSNTTCAEDCGVCCIFTRSCPRDGGDVVVNSNLTFITSTDSQHSCRFVIPRQPDICQIRLDFLQFQVGNIIVPPVEFPSPLPISEPLGPSCQQDKVKISSAANLPDGITLCGYAQDHVYLTYGNHDKFTIDVDAVTYVSYEIKVTSIKCNSINEAPEGCTQYFKGRSGEIQSFNFPYAQLNSHRYSACIANTGGADKITWRPCVPRITSTPALRGPGPGSFYSELGQFFISGKEPGIALSNPIQCPLDHVLLPGTSDERYCGGDFAGPVVSTETPFLMWVDFNDYEVPPEFEIISDTIDPTTGCPLYQTCISIDTGLPIAPLPDMSCEDSQGLCVYSQIYVDRMDQHNTGFCLEYSLG